MKLYAAWHVEVIPYGLIIQHKIRTYLSFLWHSCCTNPFMPVNFLFVLSSAEKVMQAFSGIFYIFFWAMVPSIILQALRFVGLLSGCCCKYMPLLLVDPETVLSDLPVTLPSLLSETRWSAVAESAANNLWATTERICSWALQVAGNEDDLHSQGSISSDEAPNSAFLARILFQTCISLKDYLPVQKQLRLANLEISKL